MRREYKIDPIVVNNTLITFLIIDDHVDKHFDHISDAFIIDIVLLLKGNWFFPEDFKNGFYYFESELKSFNRWYKLNWLLEENKISQAQLAGIVNIDRSRMKTQLKKPRFRG